MNSTTEQNRPKFGPRSLSVVIVARNDSDRLSETVSRVVRALSITVEEYQIVLFADGSDEGTNQEAQRCLQEFPNILLKRNPVQRGLGYCLLKSAEEVSTAFIVFVPGDNSWPYRSFVELFGNMGKADIVTSYSTNMLAVMSPVRRFASQVFTSTLNVLFRKGMHYYNGLTIYPVEFLRITPIGTHGFGFQAEALIRAIAAGRSFVEIALPVDVKTARITKNLTQANIVNAIAMTVRVFFQLNFGVGGAIAASQSDAEGQSLRNNAKHQVPPISNANIKASSTPQGGGALRIVVTGASSGIGAALASAFAADGHQVFICARRTELLYELRDKFTGVSAFSCDISDESQVEKFVDEISSREQAIDVLINCAGSFGEIGPIQLTQSESWWHTLEVNLFGTYLMIKHCLALLEGGNKPRIINFAGGGAFNPFPNYSAYACSKTAIIRLTECMAVEFQEKGIAVNAISPGIVATEFHRATVEAGEENAGRMQFRRTKALYESDGSASIENIVACARAMISPRMDGLTGKTISSNFDPWQTDAFMANVPDITRSDLYSLRRVNVVNLPDGYLRKTLSTAWADFAVGG